MKRKICIYDGITFFILDPAFRQHVLQNCARYNLQGNFDYESRQPTGSFRGKFRNFDIYTAGNSRGSGVVLGGSLHKWKNKSHNHDTFYWDDFIKVYNEILDEFDFKPELSDVWVLESGVNFHLPTNWPYKASALPNNTIFLKGEPKARLARRYPNNGYSLTIEKGGCKAKFYDKGSEFDLPYEVLRPECSCKRRTLQKLGLNTFKDLLDEKIHLKLGKQLTKEYRTLLLFQPEILQNIALTSEDRMFLLEFNTSNAWINLKRTRTDYQYQQIRNKYLALIDKYCEINYQREILTYLAQQMS
jgi:hypothetical protein